MNSINIVGRLCKKPELRCSSKGLKYTTFDVAINSGKNEKVIYIESTAFDKSAEYITSFANKGDLIEITGRLSSREIELKDVGKKYTKLTLLIDKAKVYPYCNATNSNNDVVVENETIIDGNDKGLSISFDDEELPF